MEREREREREGERDVERKRRKIAKFILSSTNNRFIVCLKWTRGLAIRVERDLGTVGANAAHKKYCSAKGGGADIGTEGPLSCTTCGGKFKTEYEISFAHSFPLFYFIFLQEIVHVPYAGVLVRPLPL